MSEMDSLVGSVRVDSSMFRACSWFNVSLVNAKSHSHNSESYDRQTYFA